MQDYLLFRKMITPVIIQVIFWIGIVLVVLAGLGSIGAGIFAKYGGSQMIFSGMLLLLLGPIAVRVYCEVVAVVFSINETLVDIRDELRQGRNHS